MKKRLSFANKKNQLDIQRVNTERNFVDEFQKSILKSVIYIFYYEKDKNQILNNEKKDFYLINYEWMKEFKIISLFEEIAKIINKINNREINFNNLEKYINPIISILLKEKISLKRKHQFYNLINVNYFKPKEIQNDSNNSPFYYLIPSEIKDTLKESIFEGQPLEIPPIKIINKDNIILIKEAKVIKVCSIHDETLKMIIKYIFNYNSEADLNSEIEYLKSSNLEKYISDRKCDPNNNKIIQKMKKNQNFIGKLNILKNNFIDDKKVKEENNISERTKLISRNINNCERFYTHQNSLEKNQNLLNQKIPNSKLNQNNKNNWANRQNKPPIFKRNNNEEYRQDYNSQTLQNFYTKRREEEPKIDNDIKLKDVKIEGDNFKILEKKIEENYKDLLKQMEDKYNKLYNHLENIYKKNDDNYKDIQKKMENLKNQNDRYIKELDEKLNNSKNIIQEYKDKNEKYKEKIKKLKEENEKLREENIKAKEKNKIKDIKLKKPEVNIQLGEDNINTKHALNFKNQIILKQKKALLIGLKNINQAPFVNSIIQCLNQIELFTNYFKDNEIINKNSLLSYAFMELIKKLSDKNIKFLEPVNFINAIYEIHCSKGYEDDNNLEISDIYLFLNFILEQFHEELKQNKNNDINLNSGTKIENDLCKNVLGNKRSIITDLFEGIFEEIIHCTSKIINNNNDYKFNKFLSLSFEIDAKKFNNKEISLFECFINARKAKTSQKYEYCQNHETFCNVSHISRFFLCPKILVIMLKYSKNNDNIKVNFEKELNITNFTKLENEDKKEDQIYNLVGVISKINNKIISSSKCKDDNNWYRFDDIDIKQISNFENDVINYGIPLILFYCKK